MQGEKVAWACSPPPLPPAPLWGTVLVHRFLHVGSLPGGAAQGKSKALAQSSEDQAGMRLGPTGDDIVPERRTPRAGDVPQPGVGMPRQSRQMG